MKYTGRISLTLVSIIVSTIEYVFELEIVKSEIFFDIIITIFAWFVGGAFDRLRFLSERDFLTEVYNRRYVDKISDHLFKNATTKHQTVSLFMLDVNNFKKLNDTYGHLSGDLILQGVAKQLLKNTRKMDVVSRWGGDEFLLLCPDLDSIAAEQMVSNILLDTDVEANKHLIGVKANLSVGKAVYPYDGTSLDQLIRVADENMYKHKDSSKMEIKL